MNSKALYLRLMSYVRVYWRIFIVALIATAITGLSDPAIAAMMKPLLDGSFVERDPAYITWVPLALIALFAVRGIATYLSTIALSWVANKVVLDLRQEMFSKLLVLPSDYYANTNSGSLISKITYDVNQVSSAATHVLVVLVRDSLAVIGLLGWMLYLDWQLTLIFFAIIPAIALVIKIVSKRMRKLSRLLQNSMGDLTHILEETTKAHRVVKVFGGQRYEDKRFYATANWLRRYEMKIKSTSALSVPVVQFIGIIALAIIIYIASANQEMTAGSFISFFAAMAMLFSPIKRLTGINEHLQRGLAAASSTFALIDESPEPDDGTQKIQRATGKIEFKDLYLKYQNSEESALNNINLLVKAGETVALVGQSGSGKSSLANLIPRFYQPTSGQVLLDDMPIESLKLSSLRKNIAIVTQDVILFNDTISANIAYGSTHGSNEKEVIAAAKAAHAMEFIEKLPDGLQTLVGENGVRLSGGQRQRLAIARALLKNAPILILDEATSALDTESERHVQAALETAKQGRTTLIIAHRLSTIEQADKIVVMNQGEIIEIGNHKTLLDKKGAYSKLYHLQFEAKTH
ncbi:MAG TPA: lipid A export permease/ATP-binding protein MsbA [Gammaproteobacteria bacterium]|nr:lipid A export permease/ATP-binding protein MsbA [Gammaproteobacteria bacterium]